MCFIRESNTYKTILKEKLEGTNGRIDLKSNTEGNTVVPGGATFSKFQSPPHLNLDLGKFKLN